MNTPKLIITTRAGSEREVALKPGSFSIGRASANDIALPDAHVSRLHATLTVNGDGFTTAILNLKNT